MNMDQISGKWDQIKGRLKEAWGDLTDTDMSSLGNSMEEASDYLQSKYSLTKEAVQEQLHKHFGSDEHNDQSNHNHRAM